jgi:hypothetical protein
MTTHDRPRLADEHQDAPEAPIFASLLREHGDVLTDVREAAQEVQQEAEQALDFSDLRFHREDEAAAASTDG